MTRSREKVEVKEISKAEELSGKLSRQDEEDKLMHSVMENDENVVKNGKLISDAINQSFSSFIPDMMFDNLVKDYSMAQHIYGESMIRLISGYSPSYIKKNIRIPEFQRELKQKIEETVKDLKDQKLLDKEGDIQPKAVKLASLILYTEELDNIIPKGILGEKIHKKSSHYGDKEEIDTYKKGDRYKDIAIKKSIKLAIRRNHTKLSESDLKVYQRQSKGEISLIYAIDASGSMKGKKIEAAKKAGVALAYKAVSEKDKVGLIAFGTEIKESLAPTLDFTQLLYKITSIRASRETNITETIKKAIELFPKDKITKHLILLTDALPTIGKEPEEETLELVSIAKAADITISLVGIDLDDKGKKLAEKIAKLGEGKLYTIKDLENMDKIVLEDYYSIM